MKHVTEANKARFLAFLGSRAAAGEGSLKTWGSQQRPPLTGTMVEDIADALVEDGTAIKETRPSGYVWKKKLAAPAPEQRPAIVVEVEPPLPPARPEPPPPPPPAPAPPPEVEVTHPAPPPEKEAAPAPAAVVEASTGEEPASDARGALASYLVTLPDAQWRAVAAARAKLLSARELIARGTDLEVEALADLEAALSGAPPAAAAPAPSAAIPSVFPGSVEAAVLAALRPRGEVGATELARVMKADPPRVSAALRSLMRKGVVERLGRGVYRVAA